MDCISFEFHLEKLATGALAPAEQEEYLVHTETCDSCRELLDLALLSAGDPHVQPELHLAERILTVTSGSGCQAAEARLPDYIDGTLEAVDAGILGLHLSNCPACSKLAAIVAELNAHLPELAEIEPDRWFVEDVLRVTTGLRPPREARAGSILTHWWRHCLRRPRFAWEAAYVGALLVLLAVGNLEGLPRFMPATHELSGTLIQSTDRILKETAGSLEGPRLIAQESLSSLRLRGRNLLEQAVELQAQVMGTLKTRASSWIEELQQSWPAGGGEPDRGGRR